jgi:ribosomal protein S2
MIFNNKSLIKKVIKNKVYIGNSSLNKDFESFVTGFRNNYYILDVNKIIFHIQKFSIFLSLLLKNKGKILFLGLNNKKEVFFTKKVNKILSSLSKKHGYLFLEEGFKPGFITNIHNSSKIKFNYNSLPDLVISFEPLSKSVLKEFNKFGILTVCVVSSKDSLREVDYPLIGNNNFLSIIFFYIDLISYLIKKNEAIPFKV